MAIKVISGNVYHKGEILGVGSVINDIDDANAERLCKCGCCEMLGGTPADGEKSLDKMTKPELIAYAENIGVEVDGNDTKAKIIEKINEAAEAPATGFPQE